MQKAPHNAMARDLHPPARRAYAPRMSRDDIEVSIVFPCLNEESTVEACVRGALQMLAECAVAGEVVVADNGSSDGTRDAAGNAGARVVDIQQRGYGNALRGGMREARGRLILFLDADLSYDIADAPAFVERLRQGADLVIGSRFRGGIDPGAMPWLHRVLGTPFMTAMANLMFGCGITDINCGMRGLTREAFDRLALNSEGMEFASEMMVKAAQMGMRIEEVPIRFHADQRGRRPHLRSFRDGWRHLQLMMHFCSVWVFLLPGLLLTLGGLALILLSLNPPVGLLTYLVALCGTTVGIQVLLLAVATQSRVRSAKFERWRGTWLYRVLTHFIRIEKGLLVGSVVGFAGIGLFAAAAWRTAAASHPEGYVSLQFDLVATKLALLGVAVFLNGAQIAFASLFLGLFGIRVADDEPEPLD